MKSWSRPESALGPPILQHQREADQRVDRQHSFRALAGVLTMGQPRTLVVSHNCFSTYQSMGKTLGSLFGQFARQALYQLYFYPSYPNVDVCASLYRITDVDVLYSVLRRKRRCGRVVGEGEIAPDNVLFGHSMEAHSTQLARKRRRFLLAARDVLWRVGSWDTKDFNAWLYEVNPEIVFLAPGDSVFPYVIARTISTRRRIPLVGYFCDDYYSVKSTVGSPIHSLHQSWLKRAIKSTVENADGLVYISPTMELEYWRLFGRHGEVIMTPCDKWVDSTKEPGIPLILSYTGNVSIGRWRTLRLIGEALSRINSGGTRAILNIYSGSIDQSIKDRLTIEGAMYFRGSLTPQGVREVIEQSDVLVHVESFEKSSIDRVRHSVSTKIPDYLASKRLILAVGPSEVASVSYLYQNRAAYVISSAQSIEPGLHRLVSSIRSYQPLVTNAFELSLRNHDGQANSLRLKSLLTKLAQGQRDNSGVGTHADAGE